ncbi:hypothetical protein [Sphingomonas psychrotolerans]|uniref:Uncharacterized protein n=1 Tax=Sphingomonas psychrotolerans TaxID=1327635 RepID=A0A2K8MHW0_9SPHN|nr:hypothetical protein [Sphingomonas psychrotolerans]ATY33467.1 hypothetical protein CVN68_17090 [Sphingomonas psychrotolerans]
MKMFLTTIALAIATPAVAQTAPANPTGQPQTAPATACTPEHAAMGHCTLNKLAVPAAAPHAGHDREGDCCQKGADGKMVCCDKRAQAGHNGH